MKKHKITLSFLSLQSRTSPSSLGSSIDLPTPTIDLKATVEQYPPHCIGFMFVQSMKISGDHLILMYKFGWRRGPFEYYGKNLGLVVVHIPTRKELFSCNNLGFVTSYDERGSYVEVPTMLTSSSYIF